jgi:Na+/H+ antiporter NhaC
MFLIHCIPWLLFVTLFVGTGVALTLRGVPNAFGQLSPAVAIIPSLVAGWLMHRGNGQERLEAFVDGMRHRDIMTMCVIFLLAGAFCQVTRDIGSIDSTVNLALYLIPSRFLLVGIFIVSMFISTAIGTSMGTIAAVTPIAAAIGAQAGFSIPLAIGTVVGGAMFGDNLSLISDTTIAAVLSQGADLRRKTKFNGAVAAVAAGFVLIFLIFAGRASADISIGPHSLLLVSPYFLLIALAFSGLNVFSTLVSSIAFAGCVGLFSHGGYTLLTLARSVSNGFGSMYELVLLTLFIGGLSGMVHKDFVREVSEKLSAWAAGRNNGHRSAQWIIGCVVSFFDLMFANNTVAIIFSGEIAREIARKNGVSPHRSATWLSTFSCVFQGIAPYTPQLLLAGAIGGVSPLSITPYVIYCYVLCVVALLSISFFPGEPDGEHPDEAAH